MDEKRETFHYTYSASRQKEIMNIREKYAPPEQKEDKLEQLRRLDRSVTRLGNTASLIVGVIGLLVFGVGVCCMAVWADTLFFVGIIVSFAGIIGIVAAFPVYIYITKRQRKKLAPEIIRLSDELMK